MQQTQTQKYNWIKAPMIFDGQNRISAVASLVNVAKLNIPLNLIKTKIKSERNFADLPFE